MTQQPPRTCEGMTTDEMVKDIWKGLYGDHTENSPGVFTRVDRLESRMSLITWGVSIIGGGVLASIGNWAWSKITGRSM